MANLKALADAFGLSMDAGTAAINKDLSHVMPTAQVMTDEDVIREKLTQYFFGGIAVPRTETEPLGDLLEEVWALDDEKADKSIKTGLTTEQELEVLSSMIRREEETRSFHPAREYRDMSRHYRRIQEILAARGTTVSDADDSGFVRVR
jgi:hypothetical protein